MKCTGYFTSHFISCLDFQSTIMNHLKLQKLAWTGHHTTQLGSYNWTLTTFWIHPFQVQVVSSVTSGYPMLLRAYGKAGNGSGMETGNGNGNAPIAGARYCACARYRYCARHCVPRGDGTVCGDGRRHRIQPHQPRRREGPLVWLRAVHLTQLCWMMKIDSFASSGQVCSLVWFTCERVWARD